MDTMYEHEKARYLNLVRRYRVDTHRFTNLLTEEIESFTYYLPSNHPLLELYYSEQCIWIKITTENLKVLLNCAKACNNFEEVKYDRITLFDFMMNECVMNGSNPHLEKLHTFNQHQSFKFPIEQFPTFISLLTLQIQHLKCLKQKKRFV
eukprot:TRINITY_DN16159_c0_g1_i1.p1 TRINITY_DN16159_c0_g1~~TRINITY_DN16159_c0_g1_i1.p1  ORF type:complete len:150 (-),score=23.81 TRINITY_DN16159_c0_g1_i1:37-486(-)